MKIVIPGGSGQVGTVLARAFQADGHQVVVLSRRPEPAPWRTIPWDSRTLGEWACELEGADVVINLAGRGVSCRYNAANRTEIMWSRIASTRVVGAAIAQSHRPPPLWLQASTATIYAHRFDQANDEACGVIGGSEPFAPDTWRFSTDVAKAWEGTLDAAVVSQTRKVKLRSAMIMSPVPGGVFDTLLGLARWGLGGRAGDGRQYMSWIHHHDFVRALYWLIDHPEVDGAVNLASPNPLPQSDFMRLLREAAGIPVGLPATTWMIELGTRLLRTESELILKSRRVVPGRLLAAGFSFTHPHWREAAEDLVRAWKDARRAHGHDAKSVLHCSQQPQNTGTG